jgi:hypothetical protein
VIAHSGARYGRGARRDIALLAQVWALDPNVELDNPLGGVVRGSDAIVVLYARVFETPIRLSVELHDVIEFSGADHVVFAGRELATHTQSGRRFDPVAIRTSRYSRYARVLRAYQLRMTGRVCS